MCSHGNFSQSFWCLPTRALNEVYHDRRWVRTRGGRHVRSSWTSPRRPPAREFPTPVRAGSWPLAPQRVPRYRRSRSRSVQSSWTRRPSSVLTVARCRIPSTWANQCKVSPRGGTVRYDVRLREASAITTTGSMRKPMTRATHARKSHVRTRAAVTRAPPCAGRGGSRGRPAPAPWP